MEKQRLVFTGSGGQGLITAAIILVEAAIIHESLEAVQTQSYGAAARGGATRSDVIISDETIDFPKVIQPNIMIALTQQAYEKYHHIIRPGGLLITDKRHVKLSQKVDAQQVELALYESIMDKIGRPVVFNIAVLGALIGMRALVSKESILNVLGERLPAEFLEMNRRALEIGFEIGSQSAI